jgi:small ubiquitin-related modifier
MNTQMSQNHSQGASQMASSAALSMAPSGSEEGQPGSMPAPLSVVSGSASSAPPAKGPASARFPSFAPVVDKSKNSDKKAPSAVVGGGAADADADAADEKKADDTKVKEISEHINIKVKSQDGNEIYFKVKRTTLFRKVMLAYCRKVGADVDAVRFLFDGVRVQPEQTPNDLEMEDEDEVDAMVAQTGG